MSTNNTFMTAKKEAIRTFAGSQQNMSILSIDKAGASSMINQTDDLAQLDYNDIAVTAQLRVKSFPNANVIQGNYNQGILIVEGSSCEIIANKIDNNIKANIALGGEKTGKTRILYNYIMNSKSGEGVFVVEGEKELLIEDNQIEFNQDGVVLVNSDGKIKGNRIVHNTRSGVLSAGRTFSHVVGNIVEGSNTGILIKDPSELTLRKNEICKNNVQVEMERRGAKKFWSLYQRENPKIKGTNAIPQATCNIF